MNNTSVAIRYIDDVERSLSTQGRLYSHYDFTEMSNEDLIKEIKKISKNLSSSAKALKRGTGILKGEY